VPLLAAPGEAIVMDAQSRLVNVRPCDAGSYCVSGLVYACPAGRFGAVSGLGSALCSGPCTAGYYCVAGSVSSRAEECGAGFYCPRGTAERKAVPAGFLGMGATATTFESVR
jgi:hypothetical protein